MGVLKKKLSFFWLLNRNCNFSSTQLPRKPLTTKTIKQFQLHKHSLLYCHLSTNTAPLPSRNPTHTQTPRFNHNLNRGTGLAQVPPAIGIPFQKRWEMHHGTKFERIARCRATPSSRGGGGSCGRWWVLRWGWSSRILWCVFGGSSWWRVLFFCMRVVFQRFCVFMDARK